MLMEILPLLHWNYAGALVALVLAGLALRRWGGAAGGRIGTVTVWLVIVLAAAWAGASLYDALMLFYR
jgi:hypothetical protein